MIESFSKVKESQKLGGSVFCLSFTFTGNISRDTNIFERREFRKQLMKLKNKSYIVISKSSKSSSFETAYI